MAADRSRGRRGPRRLEVLKDDAQDQDHARSAQDISRLFNIAGRERDVIAFLNAGVDQLRTVQAAKHALTTLAPAQLRAAIAYRRARSCDAGHGLAGQQAGRELS